MDGSLQYQLCPAPLELGRLILLQLTQNEDVSLSLFPPLLLHARDGYHCGKGGNRVCCRAPATQSEADVLDVQSSGIYVPD